LDTLRLLPTNKGSIPSSKQGGNNPASFLLDNLHLWGFLDLCGHLPYLHFLSLDDLTIYYIIIFYLIYKLKKRKNK
jgi:hypothetical protein